MFGSSLLINPVYSFKAKSRKLYLPKCAGWYDLYTGKYYLSGQSFEAEAPYEKMPVFVKAGSIIPFGPDLQYTSEKPADTLTLNIYIGADAAFNLYEDEGTNYNYEKGKYSIIPIVYNEKLKTITIEERKGHFDGMSKRKMFRLNVISADKPKQLKLDECDKSIMYEGERLSIKL